MMSATSLMEDTAGILLDFDGPVCNLFAGYPAADIAGELRAFLRHRADVADHLPDIDDPLELLRWTGMHVGALVSEVEEMQARAERKAAESAAPTRGAELCVAAAAERGKAVAIVSNNSADAIYHYLELHGFAPPVASVVGRVPAVPQRMKPDPDAVLRAAQQLAIPVRSCVLIGDSPTDVEAAQAAGARSIGYAKRPDRAAGLAAAGADLVVESMTDVANAITQAR